MMETLEQQQAKSTPNSEPHAGNTEAPPSASGEDDDYDDHNNAFQLEDAEKNGNGSPQSDEELRPKTITSDKNNGLELALENGRSKEDADTSSISETSPVAISSTDSCDTPTISCAKIEMKTTDDAEETSESYTMPSDSQESTVDIKTEGKANEVDVDVDAESSSSISYPATDVKLVEDYLSDEDDEERIESINEDTASQDEQEIDKETPSTDIKLESKSPVVDTLRDDDELHSSPAITIIDRKLAVEKEKPEENSSSVVNGSQNVDDSPATVEVLMESQVSEEERIPSVIKVEQQGMEEDASSPHYKIEEEQGETSSSAAAAEAEAEVHSETSAVYKIDDFSPDSIPDDEESLEQEENLPKVEVQSPVEVIKIESDSEDDTMQSQEEEPQVQLQVEPVPKPEYSDNFEDIKLKLPVEPTLKVKINGAHTAMLLQQKIEEQEQQQQHHHHHHHHQDEPEQEQMDVEQSAEGDELSVIASNAEKQQQEQKEEEEEEEQEPEEDDEHLKRRSSSSRSRSRSRSSRSSSVSSTSQQLVIDHPESEQNAKLQQAPEEPLLANVERENEQQKLQASKRRRTGSNSSSGNHNERKQQRMDEEEEETAATTTTTTAEPPVTEQNSASSLLLQRLQAPAPNISETTKLLSCYKCNASNFENLQQLNAHYQLCGQPVEREAPVPVAAADVAPPTPAVAPAPVLKKERFFRCARCSSVHQCWNFFLHMREVHQRYICLYCSHVFASVEKLSLHLENKHDMDQRHFNNVADWQALQTQEDRVRYLVCCNCQASFERGSQFDNHDCAELMQPCALCGLKGSHANGCRNGSTTSNRKKAAARRKRRTVKSKQQQQQQQQEEQLDHSKTKELEQLPHWLEAQAANHSGVQTDLPQPVASHENNIPAPLVEDAPQQDVLPKLVVPKIMLRVPKEFQKSVDAALSSTDTEDEEPDELPSAGRDAILGENSPATILTVDAVQQQQQQLLAMSNLSEDTETATETTSTFQEATGAMPTNVSMELDEDDDSPTAKLTRVLAEFERTKQDIQRTRAHMMAKKEQQLLQQDQPIDDEGVEQQQQQQEAPQQQTQPRWSPTPPASPHNNHINELTHVPKEQGESEQQQQQQEGHDMLPAPVLQRRDTLGSECMDLDESINEEQSQKLPEQPEQPLDELLEQQPREQLMQHMQPEEQSQEQEQEQEELSPPIPTDGIVVAGADTHTLDLQLDRPLDKFEMVEFVRVCLKTVYPFCLYCNHARRIAVNAQKLVLHLIGQHRFTATVDSITAEELHAETIVARLKSYLPALEDHYLNAVSVCSVDNGRFVEPFNERIYECFQCRYVTATHKELYTHNRRLHIKTNITCCMCRLNFFSYSELLCHICPGQAACNVFDVKFRCCLCETAPLPSAFRLMVHMRKQHQTCDICLEDCHTQAKLSAHVWKHKLLHLCYRCGIAYRNKQDISKHLFWKHGTESASCKRCLQKRWRHVYHFCVPAAQFPCDQCQFIFSKAIYLEVHKRQHAGDFRYACTEDGCEEKFVSRKMLLKHATVHEQSQETPPSEEQSLDNSQEQSELDDKHQQEQLEQQQLEEQQQQSEEQSKSGEQQDESKQEATGAAAAAAVDANVEQPKTETTAGVEQSSRKRRKKNKRNKASLEDLNLIAPNLSESDSSADSDSDAGRSTATAYQPPPKETLTLPMRGVVDDLDMPRVMLSPASESDNESETAEKNGKEKRQNEEQIKSEAKEEKKEEQREGKRGAEEQQLKQENQVEDEQKLKLETNAESESVPDIWKNLLQNQPTEIAKTEKETDVVSVVTEIEPTEEQLRPHKLHVAYSDHDYCKLQQTPPPTPKVSPKKSSLGTPNKVKRAADASSDSESSSSSSSSDSDSSSCSCGSNCSCSSSGSSSSDDDSDDESPRKQAEVPERTLSYNNEEDVNVTAVNVEEEETPRASTPSPQAPLYNESDFDTAVSDTDEEFYDAHPQKMASELLAQKRLALLQAHTHERPPGAQPGNSSYDIVENSRPSTPSLPEEAAAFADKRERLGKNKKKKRERKSTCKSASQAKLLLPTAANDEQPQMVLPPPPQQQQLQLQQQQQQQLQLQQQQQLQLQQQQQLQLQQQQQQLQLQQQQQILLPQPMLAELPLAPHLPYIDSPVVPQLQQMPESLFTPLTHRPHWQPRMSEGSSCSDADGQLKRSKRTRRPNKFYGYTSDDENMSSVLAPPLQVGMQLIKPQPPPQLTWAKEDLPTPPKHQRSSQQSHSHSQHSHSHQHQHSHSHLHSNGSSSRKRNKRTPLSGAAGTASTSAKRSAKRAKPQTPMVPKQKPLEPKQQQLPPIPTLKIRPALLMAASDSSDSSSTDDENAEINVTTLTAAYAGAAGGGAATAAATAATSTHRHPPPPTMAVPVSAAAAAVMQPAPPPPLPPPPATKAFNQPIPPALLPNPDFATLQYFKANNIRYPIRPPAGARLAREGESVYCYCRCPYDEVSEMIACDGDNCLIEWFHFECVGIMVAPQGKWFCAECRPKYSEGLYPGQLKPK